MEDILISEILTKLIYFHRDEQLFAELIDKDEPHHVSQHLNLKKQYPLYPLGGIRNDKMNFLYRYVICI